MAKEPFERVFSKIERKKLLQKVIAEKIRVVVKNSKNEVMEFQPQRVDEDLNVEGLISGSANLRNFDRVTALFYFQKERYFIMSRLKRKSDLVWILLNDPQFFKLNRRTAFRVSIPPSLDLNFQVRTIRNIDMHLKLQVIEFSSGGMRFIWEGPHRPGKGTILKGTLEWSKGKIIPVDVSVVHSPAKGVYAVRFINLNSVTISRLKLLSIEIQQTIHF